MKAVKIISRVMVMAFFWSWVLNQILPPVLMEYWIFERFGRVFGQLGTGMTILAAGLFLLTLIPHRQKPVPAPERSTLILHDLDPEKARELFADTPNAKFYCASPKMAPCKGFYDCWLRTPGTCALKDGFEGLGQEIGKCDELIIVTRNLYGGFGKEIKNALDRSISFALPYFQLVKWEVHHQPRFNKQGNLTVYVYDSESIGEYDKNALRAYAGALVRNLHKNEPRVEFIGRIDAIKEPAA